jgi:hypothetical protein
MSGQGMEYPSGSKVILNGEQKITLVKSGCATAKPRFAVACDYIDIMNEGFWEYFRAVGDNGEFELKICWEKIHPRFPEAKKAIFIKDVSFWIVTDGGTDQISQNSMELRGNSLRLTFSSDLSTQLEFFAESQGALFVSFKFNESAMSAITGFENYSYKSHWNIQIGTYDRIGREIQGGDSNYRPVLDGPLGLNISRELNGPSNSQSKWFILRHKKFGEIPSFRFRRDVYKHEYHTILNLD